MQKIISLFTGAIAWAGGLVKSAKDRVFWKQAEENKRQKVIKGAVLGVLAAAILILLGWYISGKIFSPKASDAAAQKAEARLTVVTTKECGSACWDTKLFVDALVAQGVKVDSIKTVNVGGWWPFDGKKIIKQYNISKVPTVIVEFQGKDSPDISQFFSPTLGTVVGDKFVLTKILAPYYDLAEKKIKGLIKVAYLTDKSCAECYDVAKHETALKNLGAASAETSMVDIADDEGKALISKYKITKVPTLIITGEVAEYSILTQAWAEVGIVADDGAYIFTNLDLMGDSYKNLSTGKVIKAKPPVAETPAVK